MAQGCTYRVEVHEAHAASKNETSQFCPT
jgi:hypothetical protein